MSKIESVLLEEPKIGLRAIPLLLGGALAVIGIIMCISIVLILPGLGLFLIGTLVAYSAIPKQSVDCPACGSELKARMNEKGVKCEGCGTRTPIKWNKTEGSKWTSWSAWRKITRDKDV